MGNIVPNYIDVGWKGLSFTFRFLPKGGVAVSTTDINDNSHIWESIQQLLMTNKNERVMRPYLYIGLESIVFEDNNFSTGQIAKHLIFNKLSKFEKRVVVKNIEIVIMNRTKLVISLKIQIISTRKIEENEITILRGIN